VIVESAEDPNCVADIVSRRVRSLMMAGIGPRNTKPELFVRSYLHALGFRFRLHDKQLPGRPDLVLRKHKVAIFVHGCFWHQHQGCANANIPASNRVFWGKKLRENRERDARQIAALLKDGWRVGVVWECAARRGVGDPKTFQRVERWLWTRSKYREFP
jgi:DNA mismatch endonuclease (patch repair protein)